MTCILGVNHHTGIFVTTLSSEAYTIEQRIYAHRTRTRVVINEFTITRQGALPPEDVVLVLELNQGDPSDDVDLTTSDYNATT